MKPLCILIFFFLHYRRMCSQKRQSYIRQEIKKTQHITELFKKGGKKEPQFNFSLIFSLRKEQVLTMKCYLFTR